MTGPSYFAALLGTAPTLLAVDFTADTCTVQIDGTPQTFLLDFDDGQPYAMGLGDDAVDALIGGLWEREQGEADALARDAHYGDFGAVRS